MLKALVLGGTDDHIALIESLKRRGYRTILIDHYENPPAQAVADLALGIVVTTVTIKP